MSRYRKIEVRTWSDERFRALSQIPACGQGLWFFLLTGPHTSPIPGLFRAGRAAMAEELGWDLEAFDKAFQEVFQQGMVKADLKARLVWLPNALKHNRPESPNVVKSWRGELDLLPECDLKREAFAAIREHLDSLGAAYSKAFDEITGADVEHETASGKPFSKPSGKAMPNQEQEQEQEQEERISTSNEVLVTGEPDHPPQAQDESTETTPRAESPAVLACPYGELIDLWHQTLPAHPRVVKRTETRDGYLRARWREAAVEKGWTTKAEGLAYFAEFFRFIGQSKFLSGKTPGGKDRPPFIAELDWVMRPNNFAKIVEGKYHG